MSNLGGAAFNTFQDASNATATAYMHYVQGTDPMYNATLNGIIQAMFGVSFRELPGSVQKLIQMFGPQFMQLVPGAGNAALLYQNMYQQGVTSGMFNSQDAVSAAQLAHSLTMVAQNTLYTNKGQLNTQVTHGLSGALAEQVAAQLVGGLLMEQPASSQHINLTENAVSNTHAARSQAAMAAVDLMFKNGQISVWDKEQYDNVINNIGGQVRSEAALRHAFANGSFKVGNKTYSADKWGDYSADEKKAITKAALMAYNSSPLSITEADEKQVLKELQTGEKLKFVDSKIASASQVNMLASIWGGKAAVDVIDKNSADRISKAMAESLPALNEATAILAKAFNTQDFEELQKTAKQLNLGSLSSKNDIEKIRDNLNNAFAMAAASNRSIESILTERKSIVEAVSALEGGTKFVSNQHVINMQRVRNQAQLNDAVGAFKTQEEESAAYQRSYDNASNVYGYIAALQGLMQKNPDLLSPQQKEKAERIVSSGIAALAYGDTDLAEAFNKQGMRLWKQMDMTEEQRRWFGKDSLADITNMSAIAGSAGQFQGHLKKSGFQGDAEGLTRAYRAGLELVGTDAAAWSTIIGVMRDDSYKSNAERAVKVRDTLRLSSGADAQIQAIINGISASGAQGIAQVANWALQGGGGQTVIGQHTIMKENAAWIRQQMRSGTINTPAASDDPITTFFTSLMSTDQAVTPQDFFKASVIKRMQQSRQGGGAGMTFRQAVDALKSEDTAVFGDISYIGDIKGDDKSGYRLSEKGISELAEQMGYKGRLKEFKKKFVQADGSLDWQGINSALGADRPLNIAGNKLYLGGKNLSEAAGKEQKQLDLLGGLDLTKALAGDNNIDKNEIQDVLGKSNFKEGVYKGPIERFKDLTAEQISKMMNTSATDGGPTMAMQIRDRSYKDDSVTGQAVSLLAEIKKLIEKLFDPKPNEARGN